VLVSEGWKLSIDFEEMVPKSDRQHTGLLDNFTP
jgi:hypothetical protein